jgi:hypothetical protein
MDKQQMIHMACEGILIGGLSLYFAKQLKHQHKEIEELKSIIAKNQASNEKRFEVVFNFLNNVNGGFIPSRPIQEDRVVQLPEGPAPSFVKSQKVNAAVVAQQKTTKKVKESYAPPQEPELKRLPQKKKVTIQQAVEEPSVLTTITKKNAIKVKEDIDENVKQQLAKMNEDVCGPNDEDCVDDIQDEMGTLLEEDVIEESLDTDMDD